MPDTPITDNGGALYHRNRDEHGHTRVSAVNNPAYVLLDEWPELTEFSFRPNPPIDSPFEALDVHLDKWASSRSLGNELMVGAFLGGVFSEEDARNIDTKSWVEHLVTNEEQMLNAARTFYVTSDILHIVAEASLSMPNAVLTRSDVPAPSGFLVFQEPIPYPDWDQEDGYVTAAAVRAIGWEHADQISLSGSHLARIEAGETIPGLRLWLYIDSTDVAWWDTAEYGRPPNLIPFDHTGWTFGTPWRGQNDDELAKDLWRFDETGVYRVAPHVAMLRRFLLALWTFMAQEIVPVDRMRPPRPNMKRWERTGVEIPEDGSITIVHLRRIHQTDKPVDGDVEPGEVDWSHRWLVRGHWRQIVGKEGPRLVWVRPHIKGPEDKPFVLKERLHVVHR